MSVPAASVGQGQRHVLIQQAAEPWQVRLKHGEGQLLLRQSPQGVLGLVLHMENPLAGPSKVQLMCKVLMLCIRAMHGH